MRIPTRRLLVASSVLVLGRSAELSALIATQSATTTTNRYAHSVLASRTIVLEKIGRDGLPGYVAAVSKDGETVWAEGFGYANVEQVSPVRPSTRFRVGSVAKSFTAAALGLLVEEGRIDLDIPIRRYVPLFPEKRYQITTRQLAGHVAGIRHYEGEEFLDDRRYSSVREALEIFEDDSLLFVPASQYSYSTYGWVLIGAAMGGATGEDFLELMRARVFGPLQMQDTGPDRVDSIIPRRTGYYQRSEDGVLRNAPFVDNSHKWAGGGFLSSAEDLLKFGAAHLEPGFLREETLAILFTSQRITNGAATGYGVGWYTDHDEAGRHRAWHTGGSVGGSTALLLYPNQELVVAVITNMSNVSGQLETAIQIAKEFLAP